MNIIKHKYGKRTVSLLLAVILVLCPLQVRAADNKPTIEAETSQPSKLVTTFRWVLMGECQLCGVV